MASGAGGSYNNPLKKFKYDAPNMTGPFGDINADG